MKIPMSNGKPSSGAYIGFPANSLELTRSGRWVTLYMARYCGLDWQMDLLNTYNRNNK
jgi:hypothetical protein